MCIRDSIGSTVKSDSRQNEDSRGQNKGTGGVVSLEGDLINVTSSSLSSNAYARGNAGNVYIKGQEIAVRSSTVATQAFSGSGDAGAVFLSSDGDITLEESSIKSSSFAIGSAGDVAINAIGDISAIQTTIDSSASAPYFQLLSEVSLAFGQALDQSLSVSTADELALALIPLIEAETGLNLISSSAQDLMWELQNKSWELRADLQSRLPAGIDLGYIQGTIDQQGITTVIAGFEQALGVDLEATTAAEFVREVQPLLSDEFGVVFDAQDSYQLSNQLQVLAVLSIEQRIAGGFSLQNLSNIVTEIPDSGAAGTIDIVAANIDLRDGSRLGTSGSSSNPNAAVGVISLSADETLALTDTTISAGTTGEVNAGDVGLFAPQVSLDSSYISSNNNDKGGSGGRVAVEADVIDVSNSTLTTTSNAQGDAGSIALLGDLITMENASAVAESTRADSGDAGTVTIEGRLGVSLTDSVIATRVLNQGRGSAGLIIVGSSEGYVSLTGNFQNSMTISSSTEGLGSAGSVLINAPGDITSTGAVIESSAFSPYFQLLTDVTDALEVGFGTSIQVESSEALATTLTALINQESDLNLTSRTPEQLSNDLFNIGAAQRQALQSRLPENIYLGSIQYSVDVLGLAIVADAFEQALGAEIQATTSDEFLTELQPLLSAELGVTFSASYLWELDDQLISIAVLELDQRIPGRYSLLNLYNIVTEIPDAGAAGTVDLIASNIYLQGGTGIRTTGSSTNPDAAPGIISLQAQNVLDIEDTFINAGTTGDAVAGDIYLNASSLKVFRSTVSSNNDENFTSRGQNTGSGGTVNANATDIQIVDSSLTSESFAGGDAGSVALSGETVLLSNSALFAESLTPQSGDAGEVSVVGVDSIDVDNTTLATRVLNQGAGSAGTVSLSSEGTINIDSGSAIGSSTSGTGNAGSIVIAAGDSFVSDGALIDSSASAPFFQLLDEAAVAFGSAFGQTIMVSTADELALVLVPLLEAELGVNLTASNAAELQWQLRSIGAPVEEINQRIPDGFSLFDLGFIVQAIPDAGAAGTIAVSAQKIELLAGSELGTNASSRNPASPVGVISLDAIDSLSVEQSEISAATSGGVAAGDINLSAANISVQQSQIKSDSEPGAPGNGGAINVVATNADFVASRFSTSSNGAGDAGAIQIIADDIVVADASQISSESVDSGIGFIGNAGYVAFAGSSVTIDSSVVTTNTAASAATGISYIQISGDENVSITNAEVTAGTTGVASGGYIDITAGMLDLDNSLIASTSQGFGAAGTVDLYGNNVYLTASRVATDSFSPDATATPASITIGALESLLIENEVIVSADTNGASRAGDVQILADTIGINDSSIFAESNPGATGDAGSIILASAIGEAGIDPASSILLRGGTQINSQSLADNTAAGQIGLAADQVKLIEASRISTSTAGAGNAGAIQIEADEITLVDASEISSESTASGNDATGNAGFVSLVGTNVVVESATVSTNTAATSATGASYIQITGQQNVSISDAEITAGTTGIASAGYVDVSAGLLTLSDNSLIASTSNGVGAAGTIDLSGDSVHLVGSRVATDSFSLDALASPASITIRAAGDLLIENGVTISADTNGASRAGDVEILADVIEIDASSIFAESNPGASGDAGSIILAYAIGESSLERANIILLTGGTKINSQSLAGDTTAGRIRLAADITTMLEASSISTSTVGAGDAGNIEVSVNLFDLFDGSSISSASTGDGDSGFLFLNVDATLRMFDSELSTDSDKSQGGDIVVTTSNSEILLEDSSIRASAGADGNGGNILLTADLLILDNSDVLAEAVAGNGGYINITPVLDRITVLQDFDSLISADSEEGNAGEVNIESPNTDISALVAEQNANVMQVPSLASSPCDVSAEDTSRLTGRGDGQVRPPPEGHMNITSFE